MRLIAIVLLAGATLVALAAPVVARAGSSGRERAVAAQSDIRASIASVLVAEDGTSSGPAAYMVAAHSALNALVGRSDQAFDAHSPNPGDERGALGQINALLDQVATPPYVAALHGVQVNLLAAQLSLQAALKARSLDRFQNKATEALRNLEIAQGRSSQYDVLGGIEGALANTSLGVPAGAKVLDGCASPRAAGYGVTHGWLVWKSVKLGKAAVATDGFASAKMKNGMLVLYTAAGAKVQQYCSHHHAAETSHPVVIKVSVPASASAPLYDAAQAARGKVIFAADCVSCHGANLQGVSAPAVAGTDFLKTATKNKYTVSILNTIVTQNMPFNSPASLKPSQYADVMAYLLASNCYPAGKVAFPSDPKPGFGTVVAGIQSHPAKTPDQNGVCAVN